MDISAFQKSLQRVLRNCFLAFILVISVLGVLPVKPVLAYSHYIDDFSSSPFPSPTAMFTTGTASTGLKYTCNGCIFQYSSGQIQAHQLSPLVDMSVSIEARDGDVFDFNRIWLRTTAPSSITGFGPEPFEVNFPVPINFITMIEPGSALDPSRLVTKVEISSLSPMTTLNVYLDIVDVGLFDPEIDIQRPAGTTIPDGGTDDLGILPVGSVSLQYIHANLGDSELRTSSVTASNLNNVSNFSVVGLHTSLNGNTSFLICFDIVASGSFSFDMDIASNDADENPYDIKIQGFGDGDPPGIRSFTRYKPFTSPTNEDSLVFRAIFDEKVRNVSAGDFTVTGTSASVTGAEPVSADLMMGSYPLAAGTHHTCAIMSDGSLACWGLNNTNQSIPPGGTNYTMVSAGFWHSCALMSDGSISCWGTDLNGEASPPGGTDFAMISLGERYGCAVKYDGIIDCWGLDQDGEANPPAGTDYVLVGAGYRHTCALKKDGSLACWGLDHQGQASPPPGMDFTMVSSGVYYSCALKNDGSLICWGYDGDGRASPPAGTNYAMVSAGYRHACAVKTDGSLACWGEDLYNQASPPSGTDFVMVSAGEYHSCALKDDGSIVCWGRNNYGQSIPPAGLLVDPISEAVYDLTVSGGNLPSLDGTVGLNLAPGQNITDLIGNALPAGEPAIDETYLVDNSPPEITSFIRQIPAASPTSADTLVFRVTFDEAVQNVSSGDFTLTGTTAAVSDVNPVSAATYDVTVSGGDLAGLDGIVGLDLSAGQDITDLIGNSLPVAEPALDETYIVDNSGPVPEIDQAIGQSDPAAALPINFTVDFGEGVTGFSAADLSFGGTAPGTPSAIVTGGPQVYNAAVSGLTGDGTLTITLDGGAALDLAGNLSTAPILIDNQVSFDGDPEIDLQRPAGTSIPDLGTDALGNRPIGPVSLTYTLDNSGGTDVLNVTGAAASNLMNVSGFALNTALPISVAGAETTTFEISFDVGVDGPFSLDVALASNDGDENPYLLTITGIGTGGVPEIGVLRSATAIPDGGADTIGMPGVGTVHLTYTLDNSGGTSQLVVTEISASSLTNVSNFVISPGIPINVPALSTGTFDFSFDVLDEGPFSFDMAVINNDGDENPYNIHLNGTALDLQVVMGGSTSPLDGDVLYSGPTDLQVQFSKEAQSGGGSGAADNPGNYLLVEAGANGELDTSSCFFGPGGDDQNITISGASYDILSLSATLNIGPTPLPNGSYRLLICGTTSVRDLFDIELNHGLEDAVIDFLVTDRPTLPDTGFAPNRLTNLPAQPLGKQYRPLGSLWLEIPSLGVQQTIIGVPQTAAGWDVTWLGDRIGYLSGTAFPTWNGNTVLTGHVYDANGLPGPLAGLSQLGWGERVLVHGFGGIYTYEVRSVQNWVKPTDISSVTQHEEYDWITLITCRGYDESSGSYAYRSVVRAVLTKVEAE